MNLVLKRDGRVNAIEPATHEEHARKLFALSVSQFPKTNWELVIRDSQGKEYSMLSHNPGGSQ